MTRPGARLNGTVRRVTAGLFAVAVAGLFAPVAAASPESDAGGAISAAWDASGGDGGPLGARNGDVYATGSGFGQNFATGKIFFTPATGAHYVTGAILEKYEALGGPADSDLGFPTIDEGAGRAPDSRNSTFSASDKPVIFWTPATGAHVVRGAINAGWDKLGGSAGVLGVPSEDEAYRGDVVSQKFTGGELSWNPKTKEFTTDPPDLAGQLSGLTVADDPTTAISAAHRAAGGDMGPLGAKDGDQYPIGADGVGQKYAHGAIFYTPATGAAAISGQLLEKYQSVGGPEGDLGFPTSSEADGGFAQNSRTVSFAASDKPVIFLTPDYGAVIVRGAMNAAWQKLGGAHGDLGAPMSDQAENGSVITQKFSGGAISWDRSDNTFTTEPPKLASSLAGLEIPGLDAGQPRSTPQASPSEPSKPFAWHWNWWWLLAVVPVVLLAGLIVGAALWHRRRGRADDDFDHDAFEDDDHYGSDYDDGHYDEAHYDDAHDDDAPHDDGHYDEPGYQQGRYEAHDYDEARAPTQHAADSNPFEPAAYAAAEAGTARFAGAYESASPAPSYTPAASTAASPYDDPTDIAMPVSQWAPHGGVDPIGDVDDDEPPEEAVELLSGHDNDEDDLDEQDDTDATADVMQESREHAAAPLDPDFDTDNVDTAPTPIPTLMPRTDPDAETHSGRHAAIELDEPVPSATALHLPLDDPQRAPQGYPIKADTKSGMYWSPDSRQYDDAVAEIWFASEEFARTNGFVRAD
ncbi:MULTISPECIES: LGFP repeat-containing protein [unclassified Mycolicibacterium]|uniref:LGFP repeat-containing protein n=1 Tax=unclassified Mycolicibacterium TaxID=2636767 RepID=UPI002EDB93A0